MSGHVSKFQGKPLATLTQRRSLHLALLGSGLALILGGCTTAGPDFEAPKVKAPAQFQHKEQPSRTAEEPSAATPLQTLDQWWLVLEDPTLNQLEQNALAENPGLAALTARVAEVRAKLGLADAEGRPSLVTTDTARLAGQSSERTLPLPTTPVHYRDSGDAYRLSLDLNYELDLWGRVRRTQEAAAAQLASGEAELAAARLALSADLAALYTSLRGLEQESELLQQTITLRQETLALLQAREHSGLSSQADVLRTKAELSTLEVESVELLRKQALARNALALLCGLPVSELVLESTGTLPKTPLIPAGIPSDVLRRRPDIASAEAQLHARTAEVGIAEAAKFPTLKLTAGGGFESQDLKSLLERPSQFWQVGPALSFPLLEGGRTRSNLQAAKARVEGAQAEYRQKCLLAFKEVEDALIDLQQFSLQGQALQEGQNSSTEALRLLKARYEAGLISYLEIIEAERAELQFKRSQTQNASARAGATIRLIRALGGGWQ